MPLTHMALIVARRLILPGPSLDHCICSLVLAMRTGSVLRNHRNGLSFLLGCVATRSSSTELVRMYFNTPLVAVDLAVYTFCCAQFLAVDRISAEPPDACRSFSANSACIA